jgi:hypothetical protein
MTDRARCAEKHPATDDAIIRVVREMRTLLDLHVAPMEPLTDEVARRIVKESGLADLIQTLEGS